jgi:type I restriction enzyme R subunit
MGTSPFAESVVEGVALAWLEGLGYAIFHGPEIGAGMFGAEHSDPSYCDVVLERRLRDALVRLNPDLPTGGAGQRLPGANMGLRWGLVRT